MGYIEKASLLSEQAHKGQKYGDKEYFNGHILEVVSNCFGYGWSDEETISTAFLHDVLEDTDLTYADLRKEFPVPICFAVGNLTRKSDQFLGDYLDQCMTNQISHKVKIADVSANLSNSMNKENIGRARKYSHCLNYLLKKYKG